MKVLFLTSRLPYPPDRGDRLRAFHFLRHFAQEHEVTLVSFIASEAERPFLDSLRPYCHALHTVQLSPFRSALTVGLNLWRGDPLQALYYRSTEMQTLVNGLLAQEAFDVAYVHLFRMAQYVQNWPGQRIVDLTDVISREISRSLAYRGLMWRIIYTIEQPRIVRYEQWVARTFEESWLISDGDRDVLAAACPEGKIVVIPNGVDTEGLRPLGQPPKPHQLMFVGHMGVFHNVDAASYLAYEILPLVRQQIPTATLDIVGSSPSERVQALAQLPGVVVRGFVPDLNACLNETAVFVAPLRFAAGVQNKVLEAMAAGRPVVTSSIVNEGLGAQAGQELLVADGAKATAQAVIQLLQDVSLQARLGQAGRAFVQSRFSWSTASHRLSEIRLPS